MSTPNNTSADRKPPGPQTLLVIDNEVENYLNDIISQNCHDKQIAKTIEEINTKVSLDQNKEEFKKTIEEISVINTQKTVKHKKKRTRQSHHNSKRSKPNKFNNSLRSSAKMKTMKESTTWLRDLKKREEEFKDRMTEIHRRTKERRIETEKQQLKETEEQKKNDRVRMVERHVESRLNSYEQTQ